MEVVSHPRAGILAAGQELSRRKSVQWLCCPGGADLPNAFKTSTGLSSCELVWLSLEKQSEAKGAKYALWWLFQIPEVGTREISSAPAQPEPPPLLRAAEIVAVNLHPGT